MVDGIDGSGKGTIVQALCQSARKEGLRVFDLVAYEQKHHTLPQPVELKGADIIRSSEPTHSLIGLAIRGEIIRDNGRTYPGSVIAQAYALDRFLLYTRVIIPALQTGKTVIQERGVSTSLCYQPIQRHAVQVRDILKLEGNQLALKWRPDHLVLVDVDPVEAMRRLRKRSAKQDMAVFERREFLSKARRRFTSPAFQSLFRRRGTSIHTVTTAGNINATLHTAKQLWKSVV